MNSIRINGKLEAKFNLDKTQVLVSISPPEGGDPVTYDDVIAKLRQMMVSSGIREQSIRDAIKAVEDSKRKAVDVIVAQGALAGSGQRWQCSVSAADRGAAPPAPNAPAQHGHCRLVRNQRQTARQARYRSGSIGSANVWAARQNHHDSARSMCLPRPAKSPIFVPEIMWLCL